MALHTCKSFVTWGFTDQYLWEPNFEKGMGRATYLDEKGKPKPAYFSLIKAMAIKP